MPKWFPKLSLIKLICKSASENKGNNKGEHFQLSCYIVYYIVYLCLWLKGNGKVPGLLWLPSQCQLSLQTNTVCPRLLYSDFYAGLSTVVCSRYQLRLYTSTLFLHLLIHCNWCLSSLMHSSCWSKFQVSPLILHLLICYDWHLNWLMCSYCWSTK